VRDEVGRVARTTYDASPSLLCATNERVSLTAAHLLPASLSRAPRREVLGLGAAPDDVVFTAAKGVHCEEGSYEFTTGALDTFWRSAENFKSEATNTWWNGAAGMLWAVSQAAPLRRVHVANDLYLWQYTYGDAAGYASGGFLGNAQLDGMLSFGE
jgi:hypothetical protein